MLLGCGTFIATRPRNRSSTFQHCCHRRLIRSSAPPDSIPLTLGMSLRLVALRRLAARPSTTSLTRLSAIRSYATPSQPPRPSNNTPPPPGLEGLFGSPSGKKGSTVAPKPAGSESPSGPSQPKRPDVELPGEERHGTPAEEEASEGPQRKKLSELSGKAGIKVGTGGGGGGPGGSGGSGGPGGGGFQNLSPNQLLLAALM